MSPTAIRSSDWETVYGWVFSLVSWLVFGWLVETMMLSRHDVGGCVGWLVFAFYKVFYGVVRRIAQSRKIFLTA